jgi:mono/diheme cytochrome c family protein
MPKPRPKACASTGPAATSATCTKAGEAPNLFATKLTDEQFMNVVIGGRATMPAFGLRMSPDDVWAVHAYVKSTGKYE